MGAAAYLIQLYVSQRGTGNAKKIIIKERRGERESNWDFYTQLSRNFNEMNKQHGNNISSCIGNNLATRQ